MIRNVRYAGCLALLALTTACHGECYTLRSVQATGRFGDTLVAASGNRGDAGVVGVNLTERIFADHTERYGDLWLNATGVVDTVSLYRLTLVSDPTRAPLLPGTLSPSANPAISTVYRSFSTDLPTFEKLFVHVATEDVLFELVGKNGTVVKALLNLENRQGPREACLPWT